MDASADFPPIRSKYYQRQRNQRSSGEDNFMQSLPPSVLNRHGSGNSSADQISVTDMLIFKNMANQKAVEFPSNIKSYMERCNNNMSRNGDRRSPKKNIFKRYVTKQYNQLSDRSRRSYDSSSGMSPAFGGHHRPSPPPSESDRYSERMMRMHDDAGAGNDYGHDYDHDYGHDEGYDEEPARQGPGSEYGDHYYHQRASDSDDDGMRAMDKYRNIETKGSYIKKRFLIEQLRQYKSSGMPLYIDLKDTSVSEDVLQAELNLIMEMEKNMKNVAFMKDAIFGFYEFFNFVNNLFGCYLPIENLSTEVKNAGSRLDGPLIKISERYMKDSPFSNPIFEILFILGGITVYNIGENIAKRKTKTTLQNMGLASNDVDKKDTAPTKGSGGGGGGGGSGGNWWSSWFGGGGKSKQSGSEEPQKTEIKFLEEDVDDDDPQKKDGDVLPQPNPQPQPQPQKKPKFAPPFHSASAAAAKEKVDTSLPVD